MELSQISKTKKDIWKISKYLETKLHAYKQSLGKKKKKLTKRKIEKHFVLNKNKNTYIKICWMQLKQQKRTKSQITDFSFDSKKLKNDIYVIWRERERTKKQYKQKKENTKDHIKTHEKEGEEKIFDISNFGNGWSL